MGKTVCFIIDTPILKTYESYYVFDTFINNGYRLELIDVSPFLNKDAYKKVKTNLVDYQKENVHLCKNYQALFEVLSSLPEDAYVIDSAGWDVKHYQIYKYLCKKKIKYGYMILNSCYETVANRNFFVRIKEFLKRISVERIKNAIFVRIPKSVFPNMACAFVINNSPNEIDNYKKRFYCDERTRFLVVHSNTYEEALENKNEQRIIKNRYCVWLDSYIPYHPDLANIGGTVDADAYYSSLRKFFTWIQEVYDIEVVVSAHPRSDYETHNDAYEGFRIIKNKTCILVRDAEFVLTAASTSFLYAVTYNKPMIFIYQNALEEGVPSHIRFIESVCDEFVKTPINIDLFDYKNNYMVNEQLCIDREAYQKSANSYIKCDFNGIIEGDSYKKVIIDFLENC